MKVFSQIIIFILYLLNLRIIKSEEVIINQKISSIQSNHFPQNNFFDDFSEQSEKEIDEFDKEYEVWNPPTNDQTIILDTLMDYDILKSLCNDFQIETIYVNSEELKIDCKNFQNEHNYISNDFDYQVKRVRREENDESFEGSGLDPDNETQERTNEEGQFKEEENEPTNDEKIDQNEGNESENDQNRNETNEDQIIDENDEENHIDQKPNQDQEKEKNQDQEEEKEQEQEQTKKNEAELEPQENNNENQLKDNNKQEDNKNEDNTEENVTITDQDAVDHHEEKEENVNNQEEQNPITNENNLTNKTEADESLIVQTNNNKDNLNGEAKTPKPDQINIEINETKNDENLNKETEVKSEIGTIIGVETGNDERIFPPIIKNDQNPIKSEDNSDILTKTKEKTDENGLINFEAKNNTESKKKGKTLINQEISQDNSNITTGESSKDTKRASKDGTILMVLFIGVAVVGVAAFGYHFMSKRKQTSRQNDIETNLQNHHDTIRTTLESEQQEMKPLLNHHHHHQEDQELKEIKVSSSTNNGTINNDSESTIKDNKTNEIPAKT